MPSLTIVLNEDVMKLLKKRADENLLSEREQVEDIIRRSMLSYKKSSGANTIKIDDKLVSAFSRERRGRKRKK